MAVASEEKEGVLCMLVVVLLRVGPRCRQDPRPDLAPLWSLPPDAAAPRNTCCTCAKAASRRTSLRTGPPGLGLGLGSETVDSDSAGRGPPPPRGLAILASAAERASLGGACTLCPLPRVLSVSMGGESSAANGNGNGNGNDMVTTTAWLG